MNNFIDRQHFDNTESIIRFPMIDNIVHDIKILGIPNVI